MQTSIVPQRKSGRKWIECKPHQASRFALCLGKKVLQVYPSLSAARTNLPSNSHTPAKTLKPGDRYPQTWRGTYAASLTKDQYLNLKRSQS